MEAEVSMESGCLVRVVVVGVGEMPGLCLREYVCMVAKHARVELPSLTSFYTQHQKSPFSQQPWSSGSLRFKFLVGGAPRSPWEDFQAHRKIHAVLGLCHCPSISLDLPSLHHHFLALCKSYPSALFKRCFCFHPTQQQVEQEDKRHQHLILFPPADRKTLEFHIQTLMQDLAACLLMEFESWVLHAESVGAILTTPLDSQASLSSEEVSKSKKRKLGRAQKTIGDYCLLAGSPLDANAHYSTAVELARLTGDVFWHAGALEGSVCAFMVDNIGKREQYIEDEVKFRYYEVLQLYRRATAVIFELEASLKLARFLCRKETSREVVELLMGAVEWSKSLMDASDRLVLNVEVARIFEFLGYERKAAFFSRQVAQLYLQQETRWAAISALQVLSLTSRVYHVQSKSTYPQIEAFGETKSVNNEGKKNSSHFSDSSPNGQWSTLQMDLLGDMLLASVRAGDPLASWSAAARLLRGHYPLITPSGQVSLAASLTASAERLPLGTRCSDAALPFVRLHSFPSLPTYMEIVKRVQGKKDWWAESTPSGPFIYTPFSKEGDTDNYDEVVWIVGEPVQVLVEVANPCAFEVSITNMYLSVDGGEFEPYPASVTLPSSSVRTLSLSGVPLSVGMLSVKGCIVHCFDVATEHLFEDTDELLCNAAKGLVLSDPFRNAGGSKFTHIPRPSITVVPSLPLLVAQVVGGKGAAVLYEGEIRSIQISLVNAGTVPVVEAFLSLTGRQQEHVLSVGHDVLQAALPIQPGSSVVIPVKLKAGQLASDTEIVKGTSGVTKAMKSNSSSVLLIHYAGPSTLTEDNSVNGSTDPPPGRRLALPLHIHVLRGICLMHARLISVEVKTQISRNLPNHVEATNSVDDFIKMDPYRGSWGLRLLELELWNPTDVVFEISVCVRRMSEGTNDMNYEECLYPSTRIDRDYSARVLIPLERLKLPSLEKSIHAAEGKESVSLKSERENRAELNTVIKELSSKILVKWTSGRNSMGELAIKDAIREALQASAVDILLLDPLTFAFRLCPTSVKDSAGNKVITYDREGGDYIQFRGYILSHELTPLEMLVRNNTKELISMSLSVTCRDVAGENCLNGNKASVLWAGALNGVEVHVPPLGEIVHTFALCFLVPGEYTLIGAAFIHNRDETSRTQSKQPHGSTIHEPLFCSGPPFRLHVAGTN